MIKNTDQWVSGGDCSICRKQSYCRKACKQSKNKCRKDIAKAFMNVIERTFAGKEESNNEPSIYDEVELIDLSNEPLDKNKGYDLDEAIKMCRQGYFMTNSSFSDDQSLHMWNYHLFYEDGPDLTTYQFDLHSEDFAVKPKSWFIKYAPDEIDMEILNNLHESAKRTTHLDINYEECVKSR